MHRRDLLGWTRGAAAAGFAGHALPAFAQQGHTGGVRIVDVRAHGATGDGKTLDTAAINRAIDVCHDAGGGVVYLPPGVYLVRWRVLSRDGHVAEGAFSFSIQP